MKKFVIFLLILVFLFVSLPVYAENGFPLISVNEGPVNVRRGPGLSYKVEYQLPQGIVLELLSKKYSSSGDLWFRVYDFDKNKVVYIASWLTKSTGVSISGQNADFNIRVSTDVLNVRKGPGTEFPVSDVLSKGDEEHITRIILRSDGKKWYRYEKGGKYFYIAGWLTEKIEPKKTSEDDNSSNTVQENSVAVANYYINIRSGPSLDYGKIGLVLKGDSVPVVGIAKNDNSETWIEIQYKGKTGWCYSPLFSVKNMPVLDLSPIGGNGNVIDYVNLREGPSTSYAIEEVLSKDISCSIVGVAKNVKNEIWYEVKVSGKIGWIRSDLINLHTTSKATISNITWQIAPNGINVLIYGNSLRKPTISTLENPVRLNLSFKNTLLSKDSNALLVNVLPIVRVRYSQNGLTANVIVDLTDRIPFKAYFNNGIFVVNLELPKKGEKRVELANSEIYAPVFTFNNVEYMDLNSILSVFNGKYSVNNGDLMVSFLDRSVKVSQSDFTKKDGDIYISLLALMSDFDFSVTNINNVIYIDPILTDFLETSGKLEFTFSMPPKIKKESGSYIIFADSGSFKDKLYSKSRNGDNPPEIIVKEQGKQIVTTGRKVIIEKSTEKKGILSGRIIVIDPGHGSYSGPYLDTGATGPTGVKEGVVVLEIAKKLKKLLEADGAKVILTHDTLDNPHNPTLAQRCAIANNSGGDLFMSIHLNAAVSPEAHGTETYYWHSDSLKLAEVIQHALVSELGTTDRGVKRDYLYVCRNVTTMPAILTEVVFVSNPHEEALCKQQWFLDKVAKALRDGIVTYLTETSKGG